MKTYLHLGTSGLSLSGLSLRVYDGGNVSDLSGAALTLEPLVNGTSYELDGLPERRADNNRLTLTFETPSGVYHAQRLGLADIQPSNIIIPIREVFVNAISSLSIKLFINGVDSSNLLTSIRLASDGEYNISGWGSSSLNDQYSLIWTYNGLTYAHEWVGTSISGPGTFYLQILASTCPLDISPDPQGRATFSINYSCVALGPSINLEKEMAQLLVDEGLGVRGSTIFIGRLVTLPDVDPRAESDTSYDIPLVQIINTGGSGTQNSHDGITNELLSFQVLVRAVDYNIARSRAFSVWRTLDNKHNITVVAA